MMNSLNPKKKECPDMKRTICVITGTRAEYGLLYWLMKGIQDDPELNLQVVATGMHLSPEFGLTCQEIEKDGFHVDKKIEMLLSADTASAVCKSTGLGMISFTDALNDLQPDMVVILGDRFEMLAAASVALISRIPIVHIHGGEITAGAFDDSIRHAITKMAWWHFVAADEYKKRVIQLGENPKRVFQVGGMGVDGIVKSQLLKRDELEKRLDFKFGKKNIMVTFHSVTLERGTSTRQFHEILNALDDLEDTKLIFTVPNADTEGRVLKNMIDEFVKTRLEKSASFTSMGQLNYLSALQFVDVVLGNSSSGLTEAPTFKIGTINIGDRQKGRLKADSVIDCDPDKESVLQSINRLYSADFQRKLKTVLNPYGEGHASEKILGILKKESLPKELKKEFYDL